MWKDYLYKQPTLINKTLSCYQCPNGLVKYIELKEFPPFPVRFFVDRINSPDGSSGIIQAHCWNTEPTNAPDYEFTRFWIADIYPCGSFLFQPTPSQRYISLYKFNDINSYFDAICFKYVSEQRLFIPQTFD